MAHFVAGRYSEAVKWACKSIQRKPSWRLGHAFLASILAQLNQLEEAKAAVETYLENVPNETISVLRQDIPIMKPQDVHRFKEGLRKAGLPD